MTADGADLCRVEHGDWTGPHRREAACPSAVPDRVDRNLVLALEHAVESEKLKPFEAIEVAKRCGVHVPPSIADKHAYYMSKCPGQST